MREIKTSVIKSFPFSSEIITILIILNFIFQWSAGQMYFHFIGQHFLILTLTKTHFYFDYVCTTMRILENTRFRCFKIFFLWCVVSEWRDSKSKLSVLLYRVYQQLSYANSLHHYTLFIGLGLICNTMFHFCQQNVCISLKNENETRGTKIDRYKWGVVCVNAN